MARVGIYIRWSTEDQGQGTTLEVQREACLNYCDRQGWTVSDGRVYVDDGYSGGNLYRPAMDALRRAVAAGEVDTVVAYRMDRLSRDLADATSLVGREWRGKAVVRSATEDVLPEKDEGWLNYSFRATFADYERRVIRQRTYSGKLRRSQEGLKVAGKAPYGYVRGDKPGVFALDPEKAPIVRAIFEKCAQENMGMPALCRWLNDMGYKPPRAEKWGVGNLRPILMNPVYKGRVVFGRQKFLKSTAKEAGPWRVIRQPLVDVAAAPGTLPAIVSPELWDQAQEALRKRRVWMESTSPRSLGTDRLLTGLVYCKCGSRLSVKTKGRERSSDYYRCRHDEQVERCHFNPGYIEVEILDGVVTRALLARLSARGFRERLAAALTMKVQGEVEALEGHRKALQGRLEGFDGELQDLDMQFRKKEITIEENRRFRAQIEAERAAVQAELDEVERQLGDQQREVRERHFALGQVDLAGRWGELEMQQRRAMMRHFVQKVTALRPQGSREFSVAIEWAGDAEVDVQEVQVTLPRTRKKKAQ